MSEVKSLKEIVEALVDREYVCENGELVDDTDFRLLAEFAGVKIPTYAERVAERLAIKSSEAFKQMGITLSEIFKTYQQRRDEIVERAKQDVIELRNGKDSLYTVPAGKGTLNYFCYADFVVNREKRTVVALLRGRHTRKVRARGIAKCHPDDCFNVHIGKAIALRRALGLEVPDEYLNVPQPTEVKRGDIVYLRHVNEYVTAKDGWLLDELNVQLRYNDAKVIDDSREGERE